MLANSAWSTDGCSKQRWYSALISIGRERGYRANWAANQYRQKFGVWPRGLDESPGPVGQDVRNYVKSSLIRYIKGREAREAAHA